VRYKSYISKRLDGSHTRWDFFVLPVLLIVVFSFVSFAQDTDGGSIKGKVVDAETGEPMKDVNIILSGTKKGTTTDEKGKYYLDKIPEGRQSIEFSFVGYIVHKFTRQFYDDVELSADVEMVPHHVRLEEVEVIGKTDLRDIRRRGAESNLITRTQIEGSGVGTFSELLRSLIPRAVIREEGADLYISLTRATSLVRRYHGDKNPLIIIDGFRIGTSPTGLNSLISVDDIDTMEVLRGSAAIRYGTEGRHGVILIETKPKPQPEDGMPIGIKIMGGLALGLLMFFIL